MENNTKMNQYYKIPKKEIDLLIDIANLGIDFHKERPMCEESIELRAVLYTIKLIIDKSTLKNE